MTCSYWIGHEVLDGNAAELKTLLATLATVLERLPQVRRLALKADCGLLSLDNLKALPAKWVMEISPVPWSGSILTANFQGRAKPKHPHRAYKAA